MKTQEEHIGTLAILCLEDVLRDAELLTEVLKDADFQFTIDIAKNETQYRSFINSQKYNIILSDYRLPGFDAPAALKLALELQPNIPFICVSGAIGEDLAVSLMKQGATDYVQKDRLVRLPLAIKRALEDVEIRNERNEAEAEKQRLHHEIEVYDIELKLQNEELELAKMEAAKTAEKYINLYDFAPNGYFTLSNDGKIIELNLKGAAILGKDRLKLKNSLFGSFISINSTLIFDRFLEKVFRTPGPMQTCEVLLANGNSSTHIHLTGMATAAGEQCLVTAIDISERIQNEILLSNKNQELQHINKELYIAKERAEESDRLKTAFLQNMSHEIRTPMNAIMGFADLLEGNFDNKVKLKLFTDIIRQRTGDLLDVINDILDISKIESGQLTIKMEEYNLNSLFDELTTFFIEQQKQIGKQQIKLSLLTPNKHLENIIVTDRVKLKQIFINLIGNALKFTYNGTIEFGYKTDDNQLLFFVSDTGIGIPRDKQKVVFERFAQLDQGKSKLVSGTGLGLAIVDGLVNLLGGKITLVSELGKGSTFSFALPIKASHSPLIPPIKIKEPEIYNFKNKTILIVEDDFYNAEYLKEILNGTKAAILQTINGKEAVDMALAQSVDLVLMDIRLPDMDGYEATRQIMKQKSNLKIIAQTAYASSDERQNAIDAGCIDYISKPTKQEDLLTMINKYLTQS